MMLRRSHQGADRNVRPGPTVRQRLLPSTALEGMAVFVVQLVAVVFATWPLAGRAATHVPMNLGDPLLNAYVVGWGGHAVLGNPLHLFHATLFDPVSLSLALLENMLGLSLPLAPLFWVTDNALLVTNVGLLVYPALAGLGAYLLVRQLTGSREAAFVTALAYTVTPVRLSQIAHLHVYAVWALPFVLLLLVRLTAEPDDRRANRRRVAALAVVTTAGIWASLTGTVFIGLTVLAWLLWTVARRPIRWAVLGRAFLGLGVGAALSLPVIVPYIVIRDRYPEYRHPQVVARTLSATPGSYLSPPPGGVVVREVYDELSDRYEAPVSGAEKQLFPGLWLSLTTLGAIALLLFRRRGLAVPALGLLVAGLGFVFSLGPRYGGHEDGLPLPFLLLEPVGGLTRVPARMGAVVPLGLVILGGWALGQVPPRWRRIVVGVSIVAVTLELAPQSIPVVRAPKVTAAHRALGDRGGVVLGLPTAEFDDAGAVRGETVPMDTRHLYLSTAHFRRMINGYGSYHPPSYWEVAAAVQTFPSEEAFEVFERRDVRTVVVQTDLLPGTRWEGVVERMEKWPGFHLVGRGEGVLVYDVTEAAGTAPA